MSKRKKTGEGYDYPRSAEWYAAVKLESQAALRRARERDAAARARRELKTQSGKQQRNCHD
jgi:hypothetical protein